GNARIPDHDIYLRNTGDYNHGVGWYGANKLFKGVNVDGPVLYGYSGGALGSVQTTNQNIALNWKPNGFVGIGTTSPKAALHVTGSQSEAKSTSNGYYLKYNGGGSIKSITDAGMVVGYFEGDLVVEQGLISMQVTSWSDARAKKIIGISLGAED